MISYDRTTLADFSAPMGLDEAHEIITTTYARRPFCSERPFTSELADRFLEYAAIPPEVIQPVVSEDREGYSEAISRAINAWQERASDAEVTTAICDALMARTESAESDERWERDYAQEVARVFAVPVEIGTRTFHTEAQPGRRWSGVVAQATAQAIAAQAEADPS